MKTILFTTLALSVASSTNAVFNKIADCSNDKPHQILYQSNPLASGNMTYGLFPPGILSIAKQGIPMRVVDDQRFNAWTFYCNGQAGAAPTFGTYREMVAIAENPGYTLWLDDTDPLLQVRLGSTVMAEYQQPDNLVMDGQQLLFGNNFAGRSSRLGSSTGIYLLDGGVEDTSLVNGRVSYIYDLFSCDTAVPKPVECFVTSMHGNIIAKGLKDGNLGIVKGVSLFDAKVTRTNRAHIVDVLRTFQMVDQHNFSGQKIIALPMFVADLGVRQRLWCAAQWAYSKGTAVVLAAGNNKEVTDWWTPYAIVVGATSMGTSGRSNVKMPELMLSPNYKGTSAATAYAASVLSGIASQQYWVKGSVWSMYQMIKLNSAFDIISRAVPPEMANYGWKELDWCTQLNLPRDDPDWEGLINNMQWHLDNGYLPLDSAWMDYVNDGTSAGRRLIPTRTPITSTF